MPLSRPGISRSFGQLLEGLLEVGHEVLELLLEGRLGLDALFDLPLLLHQGGALGLQIGELAVLGQVQQAPVGHHEDDVEGAIEDQPLGTRDPTEPF